MLLHDFVLSFGTRDGMGQAKEMSHRRSQNGLPLKVKRIVDLIVSFALLTAFSPLLFAVGILLFLTMGRPILFRQRRAGQYGRPFIVYKFRTMTDERGAQGQPVADRERVTRVGRLLRLFSIDELPQLWNVLRGDMSLVGPRPLLMQYLERYSAEEMQRHQVQPGITGWAQVNGRNATSWQERFALDVWYVENWRLALDALILVRTLWTVLAGEGVAHGGHVSMPEFLGSERNKS
jgi:lipopolysaccharide/colanic/teichoic acid biosynthesis glycosyltransferase